MEHFHSSPHQRKSFKLFLTYVKLFGLAPFDMIEEKAASSEQVTFKTTKILQLYQLGVAVAVVALNLKNTFRSMNSRNIEVSFDFFVDTIDCWTYTATLLSVYGPLIKSKNSLKTIFKRIFEQSRRLEINFWHKLMFALSVQILLHISFAVNLLTTLTSLSEFPIRSLLFTWVILGLGAFTILYSGLLLILCSVLRSINQSIDEMSLDQNSVSDKHIRRLNFLISEHEEVWQTCLDLNSLCGPGNLATVAITLGEFLFSTAYAQRKGYIPLHTFFWFSYYAQKSLTYLTIPFITVKEASRTGWIVSNVTIPHHDSETIDCMEAFALKNLHGTHQLTACGVVSLDTSLFGSLIGATVTYGVIMWQFRSGDI